jgi:hypothetical protein
MPNEGTVYLLHFDRPLSHARHYLGFAEDGGLEDRLERHRSGRGSKLMAAVVQAQIGFSLVRTWAGNRDFERRLKKRKCAGRICPVCSPETWNKRANVVGETRKDTA